MAADRLALKHDGHRLLTLSIFHCVNDGSLALFASALPVMRVSLALSLVEIGTVLSLGLVATMVPETKKGPERPKRKAKPSAKSVKKRKR